MEKRNYLAEYMYNPFGNSLIGLIFFDLLDIIEDLVNQIYIKAIT
jgi:hypothetical protein